MAAMWLLSGVLAALVCGFDAVSTGAEASIVISGEVLLSADSMVRELASEIVPTVLLALDVLSIALLAKLVSPARLADDEYGSERRSGFSIFGRGKLPAVLSTSEEKAEESETGFTKAINPPMEVAVDDDT